MSIHINRNRIEIVDHQIKTKSRGNIENLARKLSLSRAAAYKFLEELKEEGFPIAYSKKENCFYYERSGSMIGYVFVEDDANDNDEKHAGERDKNFLKIFSMSTYSRHWGNSFVLDFINKSFFYG